MDDDAARIVTLLGRNALQLMVTHSAESAVLLTLASTFAHDASLLRAALRAPGPVLGGVVTRRNGLLVASVKARVSVSRLKELVSLAPDMAFSEGNDRDETPLYAACRGVRRGDAPSLARALVLADRPLSRSRADSRSFV